MEMGSDDAPLSNPPEYEKTTNDDTGWATSLRLNSPSATSDSVVSANRRKQARTSGGKRARGHEAGN